MSGQLPRTLRLPHATALVVGTIIGSAVFVQASEVTHHVPNIVGVLLVWVGSGILTSSGRPRVPSWRLLFHALATEGPHPMSPARRR